MDALMGKMDRTADSFQRQTEDQSALPRKPGGVSRPDRPSNKDVTHDGTIPVSDSDEEATSAQFEANGPADHEGHLAEDSYGNLRYVGGSSNRIFIEAVQSLAPSGLEDNLEECHPTTPSSTLTKSSINVANLPFFVHNARWPSLPWLPKPEQVTRPPRYVSDLLVDLYFDHLHYTFPTLHKAQFRRSYERMLVNSPGHNNDAGFVSVFFAVCACASGLLPRQLASSGFPGLEYYEKALVLHYSTTGQAALEAVQCLGLLALCSAGWNTLAQSWKLAGQAVRAAQDLGLHVNLSANAMQHGRGKHVQQLSRRVWWAVWSLDRILSICLGRPMASDDADCTCDLPSETDDDESSDSADNTPAATPMSGFVAFAELCEIASEVVRSTRALRRSRHNGRLSTARNTHETTISLSEDLQLWLEKLPDSIRFAANRTDAAHKVDLTMCVITYMLHAASVINLQGSFLQAAASSSVPDEHPDCLSAKQQCVQASRSCIQTGELVLSRVPPSHYLAFCVHQLALAGVVLLYASSKPPPADIVQDVRACAKQLGELHGIWSGAARSKEILEQLLNASLYWSATEPFPDLFGGDMNPSLMAGFDCFMDFDETNSAFQV
ncbi:hypothetical protein LTR85_005819 [Meristemomyces frigidus]|nr:hypothetical protein LTR85_005819 [Meristemomyces frigidus]